MTHNVISQVLLYKNAVKFGCCLHNWSPNRPTAAKQGIYVRISVYVRSYLPIYCIYARVLTLTGTILEPRSLVASGYELQESTKARFILGLDSRHRLSTIVRLSSRLSLRFGAEKKSYCK